MTRSNADPLRAPATEPGQRIFTGRLFRTKRGRGRVFSQVAPEPPEPKPTRPLRAARILALAHHMQAMIDRSEVEDLATLARRLDLSRARITQLLDLLLLAPDIQEQILFTEVPPGRDPVTEHGLREVVRAALWSEQREIWANIRSQSTGALRSAEDVYVCDRSEPRNTDSSRS